MTQIVYRVTKDENGREDITDYSRRSDAEAAFNAARGREGVFSVRLEVCRYAGGSQHGAAVFTSVRTSDYWEYEGHSGLQHA
jgi:hypothetical protein